MGKSKLSVICGLKVVAAAFEEDGAGIRLDNGVSLSIYNRYGLVGFASNDQERLIGNAVTEVDEKMDSITITFEGNLALCVDMRDDAYSGPEAIQLIVPGEPIVVWN